MMRVIVEIWPGGDERRARRMAVVDVSNISGLSDVSDYVVDALLNPNQPDEKHAVRRVQSHARRLGWAALVERVMSELKLLTRGAVPLPGDGEEG